MKTSKNRNSPFVPVSSITFDKTSVSKLDLEARTNLVKEYFEQLKLMKGEKSKGTFIRGSALEKNIQNIRKDILIDFAGEFTWKPPKGKGLGQAHTTQTKELEGYLKHYANDKGLVVSI